MAVPLSPEIEQALRTRGEEILARIHNEQPSRIDLDRTDLRALQLVVHPNVWEDWRIRASLDRITDHPTAIARAGATVLLPAT